MDSPNRTASNVAPGRTKTPKLNRNLRRPTGLYDQS